MKLPSLLPVLAPLLALAPLSLALAASGSVSSGTLTSGTVTTGRGLPATTHLTLKGQTNSAWMLCDGLNRPEALVVGTPDGNGRSLITTLSKSSPGEYSYLAYIVGAGDPGAGNIYYPLSPRDGSAAGAGTDSRYNLRTFTPGALSDPGRAYTPTLTSVTLNGVTTDCRWVQGTRFLGVTERRSVLITEADDGTLSYRTFDFSGPAQPQNGQSQNGQTPPAQTQLISGADRSSAPSLSVRGGGLSAGGDSSVYTFTNNGYGYTLRAGNGGATLSVSQNGKVIQTETFSAYQLGRRSAR